MKTPLILLVEDEEAIRKIYEAYLLHAGYRVLEASNGIEALQAAQAHRPALVISDVLMPGMDGYELVQKLRRDPVLSSVPIILLSGVFVEAPSLALARSLGIHHFLTKPFSRADLLHAVSEALRCGNGLASDSNEQVDRDHNRVLVDKLAETVTGLAASEERFRQLAENIYSVFWLSDPANTKMFYISPAYQVIWGRTCESLYASPSSWAEAVHPDDRKLVLETGPRQFVSNRHERTYRIVRPDGGIRWIHDRAFPVRDQSGELVRVAGIAEDITERKRVEQALDERLRFETLLTELSASFAKLPAAQVDDEIDKWLKSLVEFLDLDRASFFHLGKDQTTIYRSHSHAAPGIEPLPLNAMNEDFPWMTEQLLEGNTIKWSRVPEEIPERASREKEYALKAGVKSGLNIPVLIGGSVICAISFTSMRSYRNWPDELVARLRLAGEIFANAVARNQAAAALRQNEADLLDITWRLMRAEDAERRRIAKELHDSTVQDLVAVMMNLESLRETATGRNSSEGKHLDDSLALLENCAHEIRTLSYVLHPPRLDEAGLVGAIRHYAGGFAERSGIAMTLDLPPDLGRLGETVEMILFRVVQEALGNIHRHSSSRTASVRLRRSASETVLEISDEGLGIPEMVLEENAERGAKLGVGISGMRERLRQIGGSLGIVSSPKGTTIRAVAPTTGEGL